MHAKSTILYITSIAIAINTEYALCEVATKIIGGQPVSIKHRPFMLSLHDSEGFVCGASILSRNWAVTALHCVTTDATQNYYVRAGSSKPYTGGSLHKLTKIHMYNDTSFQYWSSSMLYHDVALFEVRPRFRFSSTVRAVRLPNEFSKPPRKLYVCGWGYTDLQSNAKISNALRIVAVRHTPHEICVNEALEYRVLVQNDHHLCYGTRGKDSCYGDSGGPLASKSTIYGIVSFGQNCGVVSGVYENVSYYIRWIKKIANL